MTPQERIGLAVLQAISEWTRSHTAGAKIATTVVNMDWGMFTIEVWPNDKMVDARLKVKHKNDARKCKS